VACTIITAVVKMWSLILFFPFPYFSVKPHFPATVKGYALSLLHTTISWCFALTLLYKYSVFIQPLRADPASGGCR